MLLLPALEDKYSRKALFLVYTPVSTIKVVLLSCRIMHSSPHRQSHEGRQHSQNHLDSRLAPSVFTGLALLLTKPNITPCFTVIHADNGNISDMAQVGC